MSDDNVIDFKTKDRIIGDGCVVPPDQVLEAQKGNLTQVVLVGVNEAGEIITASSHGMADAFFLLHIGADTFIDGMRPK